MALDIAIIPDQLEHTARQPDAARAFALGDRARKIKKKYPRAVRGQPRQFVDDQATSLTEAHPRCYEQFREDGIPLAIAAAPGWVLGPVRQSSSQADIPEREVVADIDELHVMRACGTFPGPVTLDDLGRSPPMTMTKELVVSKRRGCDQALFERPPIQFVKRRDRPVPAGCRNPERCIRQTPCMVKRDDIVVIGTPKLLATTPFFQKPNPDEDVMGVGAQTVPRTHPHGRTGAKEPVHFMQVASVPIQKERHAIHQADPASGLGQGNGKIDRNAFDRNGRAQRRSVGEIKLRHPSSKGVRVQQTTPATPVALKPKRRQPRPYGPFDGERAGAGSSLNPKVPHNPHNAQE